MQTRRFSVLILLAALTGCSHPAADPEFTQNQLDAQAGQAVGALVRAAVVTPAVLPLGDTVVPARAVTSLTVPSLNNCGFVFTTEANRIARSQNAVVNAKGLPTGLTHDVTVYDTTESAITALTQWRKSAAACPSTPVMIGAEKGVFLVSRNAPLAALAPNDNVVTSEQFTPVGKNSKPLFLLAVIQRKGAFLSAVYYQQTRAITPQEAFAVGRVSVGAGTLLPKR